MLALEAEVDINFIRCMGVQYQFIIVLYLNKNAPVKIASYNRLGLHYKTAKPAIKKTTLTPTHPQTCNANRSNKFADYHANCTPYYLENRVQLTKPLA